MAEKRYYNFMIALTEQFLKTRQIDDIDALNAKIVELYPSAEFAIIRHDLDIKNGVPVSPHYHIILMFKDNKTISSVAEKLDIAPNFIQKWDKRTYNLVAYLTHQTTDAVREGKHDYSDYLDNPDKFRTNIDNFAKLAKGLGKNKKIDKKSETIYSLILHGYISEKELLRPENIDFYFEHQNKVDRALELYRKSLSLEPPECKTLFIEGSSGSGKSTYAKNYASKNFADFSFSSSANDPLQDYKGEPVFILDDFRPQDFDFVELLGLLDPKIRTRSHKSRYVNKVLSAELIIITSTYPLQKVLDYYAENTDEEIKQLRRRIQENKVIADHECRISRHYDEVLDDYVEDIDLDDAPFTEEQQKLI